MNIQDKFKIKAYLLTGNNGSDLIDLLLPHLKKQFLQKILTEANESDLDFDHIAHTYGPCDTLNNKDNLPYVPDPIIWG